MTLTVAIHWSLDISQAQKLGVPLSRAEGPAVSSPPVRAGDCKPRVRRPKGRYSDGGPSALMVVRPEFPALRPWLRTVGPPGPGPSGPSHNRPLFSALPNGLP